MINNPQRKTKLVDIYMQEKSYNSHLQRLSQIQRKPNLRAHLDTEARVASKYLRQLRRSKNQVKMRHENQIQHENNKLINKLVQIESVRYQVPQEEESHRHFNSYWTERKMRKQREEGNVGLVKRLVSTESLVPKLEELKKQFKKHKKISQQLKRFPSLKHHEMNYKRMFSKSQIE